MENQEIQKCKKNLELIKANSIPDLLNAKPIAGYKYDTLAKNEIGAAIVKCSDALGIELTDMAISILTADIIDVYRYDSIEDVLWCLKKGRQGYYGTTYGKLNMIVIAEWMAAHLEAKAEAREKELSQRKAKSKLEVDGVDYEAYKLKISKQSDNRIEEKKKRLGWNKFISEGIKQKVVDCPVCNNNGNKNCKGCNGHGKRKVMC